LAGRELIPFFVADRPASLKILRGIPFNKYDGPIGIMTHANTSENFQDFMRAFPCHPSHKRSECDEICARLKKRVVKMCDSGVFSKNGCPVDYPELFEIYERMQVDYGIIIDHLRSKTKTLKSARRALRVYESGDWTFKLVGVAQGISLKDYLECYERLKRLGYQHIAIGGLLKKRRNTAHYSYVRGNGVLFNVLEAIRDRYPTDWLFALGCYHPDRHLRFQKLGLFGSDYKGWIFNYRPRKDLGERRARVSRYMQVRKSIAREIFEGPLYLNGREKEIREARRPGRTLVVVSCGGKKIWDEEPDAGPTRARDAYTGLFFKCNRAYAEKFGDSWTILSAKYGLVRPSYLIKDNYNIRFSHRNEMVTTRQLREQLLAQGFHRFARVVVLGGREYGAAIEEAYAGTSIPVLRPLEKYGRIGLMIQAVKVAIDSERPFV